MAIKLKAMDAPYIRKETRHEYPMLMQTPVIPYPITTPIGGARRIRDRRQGFEVLVPYVSTYSGI